jgi:phosphoenolpyruvate synthase/pyruvate phosphate dikinase
MEPLTNALINAGGMGLLAAVLFYLHIKTLAMHRDEYRASIIEFKEEIRQLIAAFHEEVNLVRDRADARSERMAKLIADSITQATALRTDQLNRIEHKMETMWGIGRNQ